MFWVWIWRLQRIEVGDGAKCSTQLTAFLRFSTKNQIEKRFCTVSYRKGVEYQVKMNIFFFFFYSMSSKQISFNGNRTTIHITWRMNIFVLVSCRRSLSWLFHFISRFEMFLAHDKNHAAFNAAKIVRG